jgi:hypothetical protein
MFAALMLGGCGALLQGSLTVDWPEQGKQVTLTPDVCVSGERYQFYGVDMWRDGHEEARIRAILDAVDGPIVKLDIPGVAQTVTLTPASKCTVFELSVERSSTSTNDIQHIHGHLRLRCDEAGLALLADINFADCS